MPKNSKVLLRVDGNARIGVGHLFRIKALISDAPKNIEFIIACSIANKKYVEILFKDIEKLEIYAIPTKLGANHSPISSDCIIEDSEEVQKILCNFDVKTVIIDHYQINEIWWENFQAKYTVIKINDVFDAFCTAEIQFCPILQTYHDDNQYLSRLDIVGPEYILISESWRNLRNSNKIISDNKILNFSFGLVEIDNFSMSILETIINLSTKKLIINLFSSGISNEVSLKLSRLNKYTDGINSYVNNTEIFKFYSTNCIGIGGGGISSLERCCVGIPSINFILAENQRPNIEALSQNNCAFNGGIPSKINERILETQIQLIMDPYYYNAMRCNSLKTIDGLGASRLWGKLKDVGLIL